MMTTRALHSFAAVVTFSLLAACSGAPDEPASVSEPSREGAATPPPPARGGVPQTEETAASEGDDLAPPTRLAIPKDRFVDPGTPSTTTPPPATSPYAYVDPTHVVPKKLLDRAVAYYDANKTVIPNRDYLTVVDFSKHSGKQRFYVVDRKSGAVKSFVVAHGKMSDPSWTGYATSFSNVPGSNQSSVGFAVTADTYYGSHGRSLRLEGLSPTNSNMYTRAIVIHGASYVVEGAAKQGRSLGCFALDETEKDDIIDMLEGGSLLYADLGA